MNFPQIAKKPIPDGFLVHGIAEGETVVRLWNPDLAHGTLAAAQKRVDQNWPCVHRVVAVDPETSSPPVGEVKVFWSVAPARKDFARYAVDYAQPQGTNS